MTREFIELGASKAMVQIDIADGFDDFPLEAILRVNSVRDLSAGEPLPDGWIAGRRRDMRAIG
jgi:hypothetical protein